jgi:hypothetical protein
MRIMRPSISSMTARPSSMRRVQVVQVAAGLEPVLDLRATPVRGTSGERRLRTPGRLALRFTARISDSLGGS